MVTGVRRVLFRSRSVLGNPENEWLPLIGRGRSLRAQPSRSGCPDECVGFISSPARDWSTLGSREPAERVHELVARGLPPLHPLYGVLPIVLCLPVIDRSKGSDFDPGAAFPQPAQLLVALEREMREPEQLDCLCAMSAARCGYGGVLHEASSREQAAAFKPPGIVSKIADKGQRRTTVVYRSKQIVSTHGFMRRFKKLLISAHRDRSPVSRSSSGRACPRPNCGSRRRRPSRGRGSRGATSPRMGCPGLRRP